jgi:hypothetical protein
MARTVAQVSIRLTCFGSGSLIFVTGDSLPCVMVLLHQVGHQGDFQFLDGEGTLSYVEHRLAAREAAQVMVI